MPMKNFIAIKYMLLMCLLVANTSAAKDEGAACRLSGVWQHSSKLAELYVDEARGSISVYSHDEHHASIGQLVVKKLQKSPDKTRWIGKMYSAHEDAFVDVSVKLEACKRLSFYYGGEEVLAIVR